jgi:hypothetical protein
MYYNFPDSLRADKNRGFRRPSRAQRFSSPQVRGRCPRLISVAPEGPGTRTGSPRHFGCGYAALWYFGTPRRPADDRPKPEKGPEGLRKYDPQAFALLDDILGAHTIPRVQAKKPDGS